MCILHVLYLGITDDFPVMLDLISRETGSCSESKRNTNDLPALGAGLTWQKIIMLSGRFFFMFQNK